MSPHADKFDSPSALMNDRRAEKQSRRFEFNIRRGLARYAAPDTEKRKPTPLRPRKVRRGAPRAPVPLAFHQRLQLKPIFCCCVRTETETLDGRRRRRPGKPSAMVDDDVTEIGEMADQFELDVAGRGAVSARRALPLTEANCLPRRRELSTIGLDRSRQQPTNLVDINLHFG